MDQGQDLADCGCQVGIGGVVMDRSAIDPLVDADGDGARGGGKVRDHGRGGAREGIGRGTGSPARAAVKVGSWRYGPGPTPEGGANQVEEQPSEV